MLKKRLLGLLELKTQVWAACAVSLSFFAAGTVRAWASPAVPSMQADPEHALSYAPMTKETASWISE